MCFYMQQNRYKILAANDIKDGMTAEKATQIILDKVGLDTEQYRMGKTKVQYLKNNEANSFAKQILYY